MKRITDAALISPEMILARMRPEKGYSASDIANRTKCGATAVRVVMNHLVDQGVLFTLKRDRSHIAYYLVTEEQKKEPPKEFEIAQPLITHLMTGELTGFGAEMERRAALCMLVRRHA